MIASISTLVSCVTWTESGAFTLTKLHATHEWDNFSWLMRAFHHFSCVTWTKSGYFAQSAVHASHERHDFLDYLSIFTLIHVSHERRADPLHWVLFMRRMNMAVNCDYCEHFHPRFMCHMNWEQTVYTHFSPCVAWTWRFLVIISSIFTLVSCITWTENRPFTLTAVHAAHERDDF